MLVTVIIDSVPYDNYPRYHALTVDNPIPRVFYTGDWYNQNRDAIIAVTRGTVHYERTFDLTEGYHNLEYAVSCWEGHWHATIIVDSKVVAEQDSDESNHVTAQIYVGVAPPPLPAEVNVAMMGGIAVAVVDAALVAVYLLKHFKVID